MSQHLDTNSIRLGATECIGDVAIIERIAEVCGALKYLEQKAVDPDFGDAQQRLDALVKRLAELRGKLCEINGALRLDIVEDQRDAQLNVELSGDELLTLEQVLDYVETSDAPKEYAAKVGAVHEKLIEGCTFG